MSITIDKYKEYNITLEASTGRFTAVIDPVGPKVLWDNTLTGLKTKLDDWQRKSARLKARTLHAVMFAYEGGSRWGSDDGRLGALHEGTFRGVNAHTGEINFVAKNGKKVDGHILLRGPDGPVVSQIAQLVGKRNDTHLAAVKAQKALDDALKANAYEVPTYIRDTERAATIEEEVVEFLTGEKAT